MQEGAPSVRFVARARRQRRHSRSSEQMRIDRNTNGHSRYFGDEVRY